MGPLLRPACFVALALGAFGAFRAGALEERALFLPLIVGGIAGLLFDRFRKEPAPPPMASPVIDTDGFEIATEVEIPSFDPEGKAWLLELRNGSLQVVFEFMPPTREERTGPHGLGRCASFDRTMAEALASTSRGKIARSS